MKFMALLLLVLAVSLGDAVKANDPARTVPDDLADSSQLLDNWLSFHAAVPAAEAKAEWTKEEVAEAAEVASLRAEVAYAEKQLEQTDKDMKKAKSEALAASASARAKLVTTEQKAREEAAVGKKKTDAPVKLAEADQSQKKEIMKAAQAAEKAAVADEARRAEAAKKAAEAAQMADAAKKAEAAKKLEEKKRLLAATRAADMKKKTEAEEAAMKAANKAAEEARKAREAKMAVEARNAEAAKKAAEEAALKAANKAAEEARKAREAEMAVEARNAEAAKKAAEEAALKAANKAAEEARKAREAKMAVEAKNAEAAKKAAEADKKTKKAEASNHRPVIIDQDDAKDITKDATGDAKDITKDATKIGQGQVKKAQEEAKKASEEAKKAGVVKKLEDEAAKKAEEIQKARAEKKAAEEPKKTKEATKKREATEEVSIKSHEAQQVSYGNSKCQCIGFSGVQGNRLVMLGGKFVEFPGDLGSSCKAWDDGVHPACQASTKPGKGKDWCAQQWCFVDPRKCDIQELPEMSTYMPTARYQKMPLFVSRSTCDKKPASDVAGPLGLGKCSCIGFDNAPGTMKFQIGDASVTYPAETGGTCGAWDMDSNPLCAVKGDKPDFCTKKWCFVDPCSCDIGRPAKVSAALFDVSFAGKKVYYSYETCADMDVYTSKFNKVACVIEKSQDACSKKSHCSWTGSKCLGKELVDKAVCGTSPTKDAAIQRTAVTDAKGGATERSSAQQLGMLGATMAVLLLSSSFV